MQEKNTYDINVVECRTLTEHLLVNCKVFFSIVNLSSRTNTHKKKQKKKTRFEETLDIQHNKNFLL